jgi:hypothetical protein
LYFRGGVGTPLRRILSSQTSSISQIHQAAPGPLSICQIFYSAGEMIPQYKGSKLKNENQLCRIIAHEYQLERYPFLPLVLQRILLGGEDGRIIIIFEVAYPVRFDQK